jgi:single-stranded-DNA-specific exonuclease
VVAPLFEALREGGASAAPSNGGVGAERLCSALGLTRTVGDWLSQRGFSEPERVRRFLHPRLSELTRPDNMADRPVAAARIARAIRARERIAVFGDYDCDGMTAAAILSQMLRALGGEVSVLIASRFDGGYGVSPQAAERIARTGATLLVTCDCGSSDHETLAALGARGLDVIVIDHHLVPDEPLPVLAFLNPHRSECGFEYKGLASCGLALSVGAAVRSELGRALDLKSYLDLVAIGTIADVAPLDGDNRALVRAGLSALALGQRPGIRALLECAKIDGQALLGSEDVSFRLAPRLNAPGRLGSPDPALELLMATDMDRARALAAELEQASQQRRAIQDRMLAEAHDEITRDGYAEEPAIVLGREGWNHGIVGIVAGRLADRYARPVVVVGFERGRGRGSVRGPAGARLHDALSLASSTLVRFGGHQAAAGLELELEKLGVFREAFAAAVAGAPVQSSDQPVAADTVWLAAGDTPERVLTELHLLEPCGAGNPSPELLLEARVISAREVSGGHLKLELELAGGRRVGAFGIELGPRAAGLSGSIVVQGRLRRDTYRGGDAVELKLSQIVS